MKYFAADSERKNTVYHEFQKGHFDGKTFWKADSINLSDDLLFTLHIEDLFRRVIPDYSDTGESEIMPALWANILREAEAVGGAVFDCIAEADAWAKETFREYDVFTVIGI